MKRLNLLMVVIIGITISSCSSDDQSIEAPDKKLTKIVYEYSNGLEVAQSLSYDSNNNIVEITNDNNLPTDKYLYNSSNQLIQREQYGYDSQTNEITEKQTYLFSYNSTGSIITIEKETIDNYGVNTNIYNKSYTITYTDNKIVRVSNPAWDEVTFELNEDDTINNIKIVRNGTLIDDMSFTYDNNKNCISGSGYIHEGSLNSTTENINLTAVYSNKTKHAVFKSLDKHNLLTVGASFENYKNILTKRLGTNHPTEVEWYQYQSHTYKEVLENSFDNENYLTTQILSYLPNNSNFATISFIWE